MHLKRDQSEVYQTLVDLLAQKDAVVMIGAGSSIDAGYPSWDSLLEILSAKAVVIDPSKASLLKTLCKSDKLLCADEIKAILGADEFYSQLSNIFGPLSPKANLLHQIIINLPFKHFLTTNYDRLLQVAHESCQPDKYIELDLEDNQKEGNLYDSINSKDAIRHFVHVHGSIRSPQNILLTDKDYEERYTKRNDFKELLKLFFINRLIFIGFSLGDEEFMRPLKYLTTCFGEGEAKHIAILPKPDTDEEAEALTIKCRSKYRIEPLFYDSANNHEQLYSLLKQLKNDVQKRSKELLAEIVKFIASVEKSPEISDIIKPLQKLKDLINVNLGFKQIDTTLPDLQVRTKLDSEIDSIFSYVINRQPEIAIEIYRKIFEREGDGLNDRLKYRLHANIGNALNSMNKQIEAAEEYRIATDYWDNSKDAQAIRALGYILKREFDKSLEVTKKICKEYPDFPRGHALRLQSLPKNCTFNDARKSIPLRLRRDSEIAFILGGIANEQGLRKRSEIYSRIAWKGSPFWIEAGMAYASALLSSEKERAAISGGTKFIPQNKERLKEAESVLTELLTKLGQNDPANRKGVIFYNRASIRRLLERESEAQADIEEAYHCNRNDHEIIGAYALQHERSSSRNEAIRILDEYGETKTYSSLSFLLSSMLAKRSGDGDLERAVSILMPWCKKIENITPAYYRYDFLRLWSGLLCKIGKAGALPLFFSPVHLREFRSFPHLQSQTYVA
ncbi:MAG: SIR2 family NAD-dependent protein deacylase [Sedimentisphaerales bacterium]